MQPKTRAIPATILVAEDLTVQVASASLVSNFVECLGFNHLDFVVRFPTGVGASTSLIASFFEVSPTAAVATIDVEDIILATGVAPNTPYLPSKDITGAAAGAAFAFRIRAQGARVRMMLQLVAGVDITDVIVTVTRG